MLVRAYMWRMVPLYLSHHQRRISELGGIADPAVNVGAVKVGIEYMLSCLE